MSSFSNHTQPLQKCRHLGCFCAEVYRGTKNHTVGFKDLFKDRFEVIFDGTFSHWTNSTVAACDATFDPFIPQADVFCLDTVLGNDPKGELQELLCIATLSRA
jgi:hypothetical protein